MKATITFMKLVKEGQVHSGDADYLMSRVFFDLLIAGKTYRGLSSSIKQKLGSGSESARLEINAPEDYEGPLNYGGFRKTVESYYRAIIGQDASMNTTEINAPENTVNRVEKLMYDVYARD